MSSAQWAQLQGDAGRSGDAPEEDLKASLGLLAALPLTDGVQATPVVMDGMVFVVDGSGVVHAISLSTFQVQWRFDTEGGAGNCNNVAAPAVVGKFLHVGTTAGFYYVLEQRTGKVINRLDLGEPVLSAPVVGNGRVYCATLGARVFALSPKGEVAWEWDFVKEVVGFKGNRWSGADWVKFRGDRVNWKDHFVCSRDICLIGKTVVMPAGGRTVFLEDAGAKPRLRKVAVIPKFAGTEFPATLGQSADAAGNVYVQWHRRDNAGRVERIRLIDNDSDELKVDFIKVHAFGHYVALRKVEDRIFYIDSFITEGANEVINAMPRSMRERVAEETSFTNTTSSEGSKVLHVLRNDGTIDQKPFM
mgnify:CR=1 FL=1